MSSYNGTTLNMIANINGITKIDNELNYQSDNPVSNKAVCDGLDNAIPKCRVGVVWCESGTPNFDVANKTLTLPAGTRLIIGDEVISNIPEELVINYADSLQAIECPNGFIVYNIENELYINIPVTDTVSEKHVLIGAYSNYGESAYLFGNYTINGITPISDGSVTNSKLGADVIRNQTAMIIPGTDGKCVHIIANTGDININNELLKKLSAVLLQIQKGSYIVCGNEKIEMATNKQMNLLQTPGLKPILDNVSAYSDVCGFVTYNIKSNEFTMHGITEDIPVNEFFVCGYFFNAQTKAYHVSMNASYTTAGVFFDA